MKRSMQVIYEISGKAEILEIHFITNIKLVSGKSTVSGTRNSV